jgi:hypothetical protein
MLMFSFTGARGLPASFRAGSNAARHEFDCAHSRGPGEFCPLCRALMLPRIREYTVNFYLDRPSKAIETLGLQRNGDGPGAPKEFVDFALAFMSSPIRSRFFVTTLYQNWAGIYEEFDEDIHAVVGSYIINSVPASSPDVSVDEAVDEWLKGFFGPLLREIQLHEKTFTFRDERFEIVNMTDGQEDRLFAKFDPE